jgi:hypothetical protein
MDLDRGSCCTNPIFTPGASGANSSKRAVDTDGPPPPWMGKAMASTPSSSYTTLQGRVVVGNLNSTKAMASPTIRSTRKETVTDGHEYTVVTVGYMNSLDSSAAHHQSTTGSPLTQTIAYCTAHRRSRTFSYLLTTTYCFIP